MPDFFKGRCVPAASVQPGQGEVAHALRADVPHASQIVGAGAAKRAGVAGQGRLKAAAAGQVGAGVAGLGRGQKNGKAIHPKASGKVHGAGVVGEQQA